MRYLIRLTNNSTIRLDARTAEMAIVLATEISPAIQSHEAKVADVRAVGTRYVANGWQAGAAA